MRHTPPVAIVDDDPAVAELLRKALKTAGVAPVVYGNGEDFLASCGELAPGCVVLDVNLPGMSGIEALQELRRRGSHVPAIVISGTVDDDVAADAASLDTAQLLQKPFDLPELVRAVRALADRDAPLA